MNYWIIADTHFGHKKMISHRGISYEKKIFSNTINSLRGDDALIHLGDVSLDENNKEWNNDFTEIINPFTKILVRGNHDSKSIKWYISAGWSFVCDSFILNMYGHKILFSHVPTIIGDHTINIHGHCHSQPRIEECAGYIDARCYLVSMEKLNCKLITLENIIKEFECLKK